MRPVRSNNAKDLEKYADILDLAVVNMSGAGKDTYHPVSGVGGREQKGGVCSNSERFCYSRSRVSSYSN